MKALEELRVKNVYVTGKNDELEFYRRFDRLETARGTLRTHPFNQLLLWIAGLRVSKHAKNSPGTLMQ